MTTLPINTHSFITSMCPCDCPDLLKDQSWLVTLVGLAISVAGVASMIMTQSYGGIIGFVLFGAMVFYEQCWKEERDIVNLTAQIQKSDQDLTQKQQEIVALTDKLASIEKKSQAAQQQLTQDIANLQTINAGLQQAADTRTTEQNKLVQENQTLADLNKTSGQQIEALKIGSEALGRRIQDFIAQNQKFLPQINSLSDISHHLESSEHSFQVAIENDLQAFTKGLETWKEQTDAIISENQVLANQIGELKATMGEGQKMFEQSSLLRQQVEQDRIINEQSEKHIQQVKSEIAALQERISQDRTAIETILIRIQAEREKISAQQNTPPLT